MPFLALGTGKNTEYFVKNVRFTTSDVCSAFGTETIGTKVTNHNMFLAAAERAVESFDWATCRQSGQGFIACPEAIPFVSSGCGPRSADPADYVVRTHRGRVELFLRRECAAQAESLNLVIYTREAYNADPDVIAEGKIVDGDITHVIVAVLANAGPKPQLSPLRFAHNLGGGNNEALGWTGDEIRTKAVEILAYDSAWATVAD